ncbi:MAG: flippase-like domain-containing protein [Candidatus Omnitrophica bacterium]|nr:flippase-like domain-containing protein [Candidatus Omnitrophota bacterium]
MQRLKNISAALRGHLLQLAMFAAGLALLGWVFSWVHLSNLRAALTDLGPWAWALPSVYLFMTVWDIWGWRIIFEEQDRGLMRFKSLFLIHTACQAVNNITPFVDVGGEFLKMRLVSRRFGLPNERVLSSILIQRTMLFVSENFFWALGLVPVFFVWDVSGRLRMILLAGAALFTAMGAALLWVQTKGIFMTLLGGFRIIGIDPEFIRKTGTTLAGTDEAIRAFYTARGRRWIASLALHFLGWVSGGLEVYWIFRLLGHPIGMAEAVTIEALIQLIRTVSFYVPGNLGVQEGALALLAQWMGLHPSAGVMVSLLKRYRHLTWTLIGFGIWFMIELRFKFSGSRTHEQIDAV